MLKVFRLVARAELSVCIDPFFGVASNSRLCSKLKLKISFICLFMVNIFDSRYNYGMQEASM